MAIKKRNKVTAQFNMSSLTDIIFLLLIFFMLTSSLVAPNALNLKLPGSTRSQATTPSRIDEVSIGRSGDFYLNGKRVDLETLRSQLRQAVSRSRQQLNISIAPEKGAPVEYVVAVMDIALELNINAILATEE